LTNYYNYLALLSKATIPIVDLSVRQLNQINLLGLRKRLGLLGVKSKRLGYFDRAQLLAPPTVDKPPSNVFVSDRLLCPVR